MSSCGCSDLGLVRSRNEDRWGCIGSRFFVVADGVGGNPAGNVAAEHAVWSMCQWVRGMTLGQFDDDPEGCLALSVEKANRHILDLSSQESGWEGMGTTVCCLYIDDDICYHAHVGDSRIYCLRDGVLHQLTEDHCCRASDRPGGYPGQRSHVLTQALGMKDDAEPSVGALDLQEGDLFLMCSDGLHDSLSDSAILDCLLDDTQSKDAIGYDEGIIQRDRLDVVSRNLIHKAKSQGGQDNITLILVQVGDTLS